MIFLNLQRERQVPSGYQPSVLCARDVLGCLFAHAFAPSLTSRPYVTLCDKSDELTMPLDSNLRSDVKLCLSENPPLEKWQPS